MHSDPLGSEGHHARICVPIVCVFLRVWCRGEGIQAGSAGTTEHGAERSIGSRRRHKQCTECWHLGCYLTVLGALLIHHR